LKKKKLTNKEITEAISGLSYNDQVLQKESIEMKQIFSLYLQYRNKTFNEDIEGFNEFVKAKVEEFEKQQRSEITKGT
tara:strand:+ start:415 stop:648 length:234 start_codon:yes stop_codon:yes gene_type:complete